MNEQVKFSAEQPRAQSSKHTKRTGTQILTIINGEGQNIENGDVSYNADLSFTGSAGPNQTAEIRDWGVPAHHPVSVDASGHFSALLLDQPPGLHDYSVRTSDGRESSPWQVLVKVSATLKIESVRGPDGEPIENGASTTHNHLSFVGLGMPNQTVDLSDNGERLQTVNVDSTGHWSALVEGLPTGSHEFTARQADQESAPWQILLRKPAPLSIQFAFSKPGFQLIADQGSTSDTAVTLVGTANPFERGWIVDYNSELVYVAADENGVYNATIENLAEKFHTFRFKSDQDRVSNTWTVRVITSRVG
ncbi:hypothetical protein [Pseudomonas fluorescens]|uniref:Bacterial Ig-like domain-containing protein n=1 Tax=Pseudomonas fluorescens TaxID=294 RepID=A0A423LMF3_PSEFL|nr:hypothetical protein [Pseudomonas fluorescens]RON69497.1 hypothetical protein BK671_08705 [Pseudomonas fluorescens]